MPDYSRKRKEPVATIKMTTRARNRGYHRDPYQTDHVTFDDGHGTSFENEMLRSKVDPAKYLALLLGSTISLTTDSITSNLRLSHPSGGSGAKLSDALLQELSSHQFKSDSSGSNSTCHIHSGSKSRVLGTRRTATAPSKRSRTQHPLQRPNSTGSGVLPNISTSSANLKSGKSPMYEVTCEYDADVTLVDPDMVLDQGSEFVIPGSPTRGQDDRSTTPPVPSIEVLSKRQLKLLGTNTDTVSSTSNSNVDKALSELIISEKPIHPTKKDITPNELYDLVGHVSENMMVNRARLLLMQHRNEYILDAALPIYPGGKPITAPPCLLRPSPSTVTIDSRGTGTTTDRASTAPANKTYRKVRPSKLRSNHGCATWSVPCKSESRKRSTKLKEPFTVQSINMTTSRNHFPAPPPSDQSSTSLSTLTSCRSSSDGGNGLLNGLQDQLKRLPHSQRCAHYKDPFNFESKGYSPLPEEVSLSETPLLQATFSSLSSFLPSNPDIC